MAKRGLTHAEQNFKKQIGQSATIERTDVKSDAVQVANMKLLSLGAELNPVPGSLKYMGSAAVHVFWNETLQQVFFASQANTLVKQGCPEILAIHATTDLNGELMRAYGHKRPRLRSGF